METTEPNTHVVSPYQSFSVRKQCGVWRFCYDTRNGVIEQCDGCGRYRLNGDIDVEEGDDG